jgi:endo-1,4-beta-D-glucanase Y
MRWLTPHRGWICLAVAVSIIGSGCGQSRRLPTTDRSDREWLRDAWEAQKRLYLRPDGYLVDRTRTDAPVTSEGQAYALMQAAWMRDRDTFTRVFDWTERHLKRPDGLYSWLWTADDGGRVVDDNSATDADTDIAFALVLAAAAFDAPHLLDRARDIVVAVRTHASLAVKRGWIVLPGRWAAPDRITSLSYFSPFAYEYFDEIDPSGRWSEAIHAGYDLLEASLQGQPPRLPPDFVSVDLAGRPTGLPAGSRLSPNFSYDAMRVFWRVDLDCRLHRRARACVERGGARQAAVVMGRDGRLVDRYAVDATPLSTRESLSFYGALLPAVEVVAPAQAGWIRTQRLTPPALDELLVRNDRYYDFNWTWFGLASTSGLTVERTPRVRELRGSYRPATPSAPRPR